MEKKVSFSLIVDIVYEAISKYMKWEIYHHH